MKWIVLVLLMIRLVSAVDVDFDCLDEIFVDEEFECSLEVFDGDGVYDVKVDLDGERDSVVKLWNNGEWKSGYYYLREFIEDGGEEDVRLKVSKEGRYDGVLKLRQGDKREEFDIEILVSQAKVVEEFIAGVDGEVVEDEVIVLGKGAEVVVLNEEVVEVDELVYVSKDARVVDWLPYGFALFLIFVIGILLWERF